jgi:hypothetical protein
MRHAILFLLAAAPLYSRTMIVAAGRSGVIEIIDPFTLVTAGRIPFHIAPGGAGLNGVSVSSDGRQIYVEGPTPDEPKACCFLYSIDLATLQTKVAGTIPGASSRDSLLLSGGVMHPAASIIDKAAVSSMREDLKLLSPDGRWLFGVRSFRGPLLDIYDVAGKSLVRQLSPSGLTGNWSPRGAWSGDRFYFYASGDDGSGRLWTVGPADSQLSEGAPVPSLDQATRCPGFADKGLAAAGGNLFLYERFGYKLDRRVGCRSAIPGGAWIVDPSTGQLTKQIAPNLHFADLIASEGGSEFYGLAPGDAHWQSPVELVRIDAHTGEVLGSRMLDSGFWRFAVAGLNIVPGDVR